MTNVKYTYTAEHGSYAVGTFDSVEEALESILETQYVGNLPEFVEEWIEDKNDLSDVNETIDQWGFRIYDI